MCLRAGGCVQASGAILPVIPAESNGPKVLDFGHFRSVLGFNETCKPKVLNRGEHPGSSLRSPTDSKLRHSGTLEQVRHRAGTGVESRVQTNRERWS